MPSGSSATSGTFLDSAPDVYSGITTNPASAAAWNWFTPGGVTQRTNNNVPATFALTDQPWLLVNRDVTTASQDDVYVAYDHFPNGNNCVGNACNMHVAVSYGLNPPRASRKSPTLPRGAVASVGCLFFDAGGQPCISTLDRRTIGISHAELRSVPVRVGLAAGAHKLGATLALARGGVLDVLIVDAPLAQQLREAVNGA